MSNLNVGLVAAQVAAILNIPNTNGLGVITSIPFSLFDPVSGYYATINSSGILQTSAGGGGGGSNAAAGLTGSAVPTSASYNGVNIGGTLRGQTGVNPSGSVYASQNDLTSVGGTTFSLGQQLAAASLPVVLTASQIATLTPPAAITNFALETGGNLATIAGAIISSVIQSNIKQINGVVPLMGNGTTGTGSQRVTIASDNTAFSVNAIQSGTWTVQPGNTANTTPWLTKPHDGTNPLFLSAAALADTTSNPTIGGIQNFNMMFNGTTWDRIRGDTTNGIWVNIKAGAGSGGTALADNAAFTAGTTNGTPMMGFYHSTIDTVTDNHSAVIAIDSKRNMFTVLRDAAGNARGVNVTAANELLVNVNNASIVVTATNLQENLNQIAGNAISTAASGTQLVGIADGLGNALTSNSTTYTSKKALDANLLGTLGTAFSTAGFVDIKGADGNIFIRQATAANLNATVVPGNATGSAVPANAFYHGLQAKTSLPTAGSDGNLVGAMSDKFGRPVSLVGSIRDLRTTQTTTISSSTSETTIFTAVASVFLDIVMIIVSNTSATALRIDFRDTTAGSVIFSLYVPGGDTRGFSIPGETLPQTSVNTNWTAQCSASVADVRIAVLVDKNK